MKKVLVVFYLFIFVWLFSPFYVRAIEPEKEELREGFYYEEEANILNEAYDLNINKVSPYENGFVVTGSGKDDDAIIPHLDFFINYPYVALYDENGMVWSTLDKTIGFGEYRSGVVVGEDVIAFGCYEDGSGKVKLLLTCFNKYGNVKTRITFDDNKSSFGYYILYEDGYYYLVGTTSANHFLVDTNDMAEKIFILKMNSNFQKEKIIFLHNKDNSQLYDACICNHYLYVYGRLSGTGEYENEAPYSVDALFSIDDSLTYIEHKMITHFKHMKIGANGDGVYLFSSSNNLDNLKITEYSERLEHVGVSHPYVNKSMKIENITIGSSISAGPISLYAVCENNNKYYEVFSSIDLHIEINTTLSREILNKDESAAISFTKGYFNLFSNLNTTKNIKKIIYIKEDNSGCYCNGVKAEKEVVELDTSVFGTYKQNVIYHYHNLDIYTYQDLVIALNVSIVDKGIYDREIKLLFNGEGYLDSEKINNGYVLNEEGRHVLVINGKGETKTFTFEIKKLTIDEEEFSSDNLDVNYLKDSGTKTSGNNNPNDSYSSSSLRLNHFDTEGEANYYIVIVFVLVGLLLGIFLPFEKIFKKGKGNKND